MNDRNNIPFTAKVKLIHLVKCSYLMFGLA